MRTLLRSILLSAVLLAVFSACTPEKKQRNDLDGRAVLEAKCASCHNLDIPPQTFPDEKAPPMMAVAFHIYDFIEVDTPAEKIPASIAFVKDYVFSPSREKSFCDKKSLDNYGLMPSQKGNLSEEELEAAAIYMFDYYNQENFLRIMKERQQIRDMDSGERVARKHGCISCHGITQKKMGPALRAIAKRYEDDEEQIKRSIRSGTRDRWEEANHARMPSFRDLNDTELESVTSWIMEQK